MRLLSLLFLLSQTLHATARLTLIDKDYDRVTVPTFDFFEYRSNPYNVTGIACRVELVKDSSTQLCKIVAPPALETTNFTQTFNETILFANFTEAQACGVVTISELFGKNSEMQPLLERAGYPPSKTLVIFTGASPAGGDISCPPDTPYAAPKFSIPDAPPPPNVNIVLVNGNRMMELLRMLNGIRSFGFNAVQETDPWNKAFLSLGYAIFSWTKFSIYLTSLVVALGTALRSHKGNIVAISLRNAIFWASALAAIAHAAASPMRHYTYVRKHLELLGNFLPGIAFFMVLYLWSVFFAQIRPGRSIYILRFLIILGVLIVIFVNAYNFLHIHQIYIPRIVDIFFQSVICIMILHQCVMTIVSVAFGISFYRIKKSDNMSPQTVVALNRLSLLAFAGFLLCTAAFIINCLFSSRDHCKVTRYLLGIVLKEIMFLLWPVTLLFVLKVKTE